MIIIPPHIRNNCPKLLFLVFPFGTPERDKICCETLKKILPYNNKKKLTGDMQN